MKKSDKKKRPSPLGTAVERTPHGKGIKARKISTLKHKVLEKMKASGRNPDGTFAVDNPWSYRYAKRIYSVDDLMGRRRIFENAGALAEAFVEYVKHNNSTPWMKKELVKGGGLAGMVVDVPTIPPLTIRGFCAFQGLGYATFKLMRTRAKKENDRDLLAVMEFIYTTVETQSIEGAAVGAYNANIISRLLGLAEVVDNNVTVEAKQRVADAFPLDEEYENGKQGGKVIKSKKLRQK